MNVTNIMRMNSNNFQINNLELTEAENGRLKFSVCVSYFRDFNNGEDLIFSGETGEIVFKSTTLQKSNEKENQVMMAFFFFQDF